MEKTESISSTDIPRGSWKRKLTDEFYPHQEFAVSPLEGIQLLGLAYRMFTYGRNERKNHRIPHMDPFATQFKDALMGVPLGGIGGGTIGRGWRGDFLRWTVLPAAIPAINVVGVDQFSLFSKNVGDDSTARASVLHAPQQNKTSAIRKQKVESCWDFGIRGDKSHYHGLFPRAWTVYDGETDPDLKVTCMQVSPVIPNDYEKSSYPCAVFHWTIENRSTDADKEVSLMFSFKNGMGSSSDNNGGHHNEHFSHKGAKGVKMVHAWDHEIFDDGASLNYSDPLSFAIATDAADEEVIYTSRFETENFTSLI